jgi:hypothetical protein
MSLVSKVPNVGNIHLVPVRGHMLEELNTQLSVQRPAKLQAGALALDCHNPGIQDCGYVDEEEDFGHSKVLVGAFHVHQGCSVAFVRKTQQQHHRIPPLHMVDNLDGQEYHEFYRLRRSSHGSSSFVEFDVFLCT